MTDVAAMLKPLIEQARQEDKWLFCAYQQMWFSPDELEAENARGRFLWGPDNWMLRDPIEKLDQIDRIVRGLENEKREMMRKITEQEKSNERHRRK